MKRFRVCFAVLASWSALLCVVLAFFPHVGQYHLVAAGVAFIATAIVGACVWVAALRGERQLQNEMDQIFAENDSAATNVIREVSVPCLLIDEEGRIVWRNAIFSRILDEDDIRKVLPQFNPKAPLAAMPVEYAGSAYQAMNIVIRRPSTKRNLVFQYWLDRTEAAHYKRLFEEQMPYVALIYVDNYEELAADTQFQQSTVLAEVERVVSGAVKAACGIYRRYDNGRFLAVFEAKAMDSMEEQRFPLLEAARKIETGTNTQVSLSIAVGVADRVAQSDASARQAMELALGRGGDQAVVKVGTNYRFYGGRRQLETMQSRVKSRLFSKALRQLFENSGDIVIMGHRRADLDCIGAALGIVTCARSIGSRVNIVLDENNAAIDRVVEMIGSNNGYNGLLVSPEQAERMMKPTTVLVVVDTQRPSTVCAPKLIGMASRLVVIDHHRRSADHLDNTTLHLLESRASSASELVTEILQYFDDNMRPPAMVCGTLLAGITVDTKHFAFNVGARTFEAAAYLRRNGADIAVVKQFFQDDMESYGDCANTVRSADLVHGGIAVAVVDEGVRNASLIAAKAADELIGIRGIEAAFVMGREEGKINVSGRSLGKVNAQLVCEKLGGGGHLTMAGATLTDMEMEEAELLLRSKIDEYVQEAGQKA